MVKKVIEILVSTYDFVLDFIGPADGLSFIIYSTKGKSRLEQLSIVERL